MLDPAFLKLLRPTRAVQGTARPATPRSVKALARKAASSTVDRYREPLRVGAANSVEPEIAGAALALLDSLSLDSVEAADRDTLATAELMLPRLEAGSLVGAVTLAKGVREALAVKLRSEQWMLAAPGSWMEEVRVEAQTGRRHGSWDALRHEICGCDPEAYAALVVDARAALDGAEDLVARRIASAFPDEGWGDGLLTPAVLATPRESLRELLSACRSIESARAALSWPRELADAAPDLTVALGAELLPIWETLLARLLQKPKYGPLHKTPPRRVAQCVAQLGGPEAAQLLASFAAHPILSALVAGYFERHPEQVGTLTGSRAASALATRIEQRPDRVPVGAEAPELLRTRSWRPVKGARLPRMDGLAIPEVEARIELRLAPEPAAREMNAAELEAWEALERWHAPALYQEVRDQGRVVEVLRVPPERGLARFNAGEAWVSDMPRFVAVHGCGALPGITRGAWIRNLDYDDGGTLNALAGLIAPETALIWAQLAAQRKPSRARALSWLRRHPRVAAQGLIPAALGAPSKTQKAALAALLIVARSDASAVRSVAVELAAEAAVVDLVTRPPRITGKPPKRPDFLQIELLPQVMFDGAALDDDAVDALIELLSLRPGALGFRLDALAGLDADSLDAFALSLLEQWATHDAPGRHDWMLHAAVTLDAPRAQRRVAELARAWARNKQAWALRATEALAAIGDDRAVMHLAHIEATTRFSKLRSHARRLLDELAEVRGLSPDELQDRAVPDLGLGDGPVVLDYGPRQFTARLNGALSVVLIDADGAVLKRIPPARKSDDPAKVGVAKERLRALRKDLKAVEGRQRARLEQALVRQRRWPMELLRTQVFTHPLLRWAAQGLVWVADNGAFRPREEGDFADVEDEAFVPRGSVRLAHPAVDALSAWAEQFADYELIQPVEQLVRDAAPWDGGLPTGKLKAGRLIGLLESRGWTRSSAGWIAAWTRAAGPLTVRIGITPGIEIAYLREGGMEQTVESVMVLGDGEVALDALDALDPIASAELARDLAAL